MAVSGDRRVFWVGSIAVLMLPAEVDISNAEQVRENLLGVVAQNASLVIADMTATTFCDSAGVTALVRAVQKANASGTGLRVAAGAPAVTRVLAITGVDRLIEIFPSVAAAMADPGAGTAGQDRSAHPGPAGQADADGRAPQPG
jgi:anti-sigma B factor antagonist